ncbi:MULTISPECIES: hypothetical protein [unclassified Dietzia]|uniref:hypothetical protein n=1 Tax=unclassified Dietzia TaxID=2617939 RepID=UPI0015FB4977|nr:MULTISPECIES: hypothetical protein [unclassified Dietzia]MBB1025588.1 hypothetical protein [Dietzia sp. DQ12-76]MBB1026412.1 hypothetical protein [Dietzia sp. DQ11-38-2]
MTAQFTEASWTDREIGQASAQARWMEGFTRVTDPGWKMRGDRDAGLPNSIGMSSPQQPVTRNFTLSYPTGSPLATGADDNRSSFGSPTSSEIVPSRNTGDDLWMGRFPSGPFQGETQPAHASHCMSFPTPASMTATTTTCSAGSNPAPRLVAHQNTVGYTYSIVASGAGTKTARVNVSGFGSIAQCFPDGTSSATITENNSVLELANHTGSLNYSYNREQSIKSFIPNSDDSAVRYDGTTNQWARYNVNNNFWGTAPDASFVLLANIRKNTFLTDYYALAEMDMVIQVYSAGGGSSDNATFIDQINLPITRSECGFSNGTSPMPMRAGTWRGDPHQLGWPEKWQTVVPNANGRLQTVTHDSTGTSPADATVGVSSRMALQAESETTTLPTGTTVTSPIDRATGTDTSTAAPPDPSGENTNTTAGTTSATPTATATPPATTSNTTTSTSHATAIPTEPGTLSATAQTQTVGTVEADGTELDVVVKGATVPSDAPTALPALDTWINEGTRPSGVWRTLASSDPDSDGWRWAAVNRETGTVVYVR